MSISITQTIEREDKTWIRSYSSSNADGSIYIGVNIGETTVFMTIGQAEKLQSELGDAISDGYSTAMEAARSLATN